MFDVRPITLGAGSHCFASGNYLRIVNQKNKKEYF